MDAQARLMALNIEKKALAKQIRDGAKNFKKKKQRQHEQGSNSMLRVLVLAVYLLSSGSQEVAAQCRCIRRRKSACIDEDTSRTQGMSVVGKWISTMSAEDEETILHSDLPAAQRVREEARRFLADAHTAIWALKNNKRKGHAPTSQQVWMEKCVARGQGQGSIGGEPSATPTKRAAAWALRWRRRWFFKYGKIRTRERMELDAVQEKA